MKSTKIADVVSVQSDRDNPILMSFQNAEMGYKTDSQVHCFRAEDMDRTSAEEPTPSRMAVLISDQQAYRGYVGENLPSDLMNTYVAIRNKRTGKMRLIQLEECTMLNSCYDDNKNKFQEEESSLTLMRKFGGKMAIRALERIERSSSNIDVMSESIEHTVTKYDDDQFTEDKAFAKMKVEGELILASMKPPRNPEAKTPAEVYRLQDMLSKMVLDNLRTVGLGLLEKEPETLEFANVYLTNKVKAALQSKEPDSDENVRTLQICLYMDALCRLLGSHGSNFDKISCSPFSNDLYREIKQNFSQVNQHKPTKTKYTVHKALTYYLALAFMLENGVLNVDQVHGGLNITKNDLLKFAAFVGGSYNSVKNSLTLRMTESSSAGRSSFGGRKRFGKRK
ncbi:uncharacterized protein LOC110674739 [Aedes aegypti]|uniref:Uncharacterized protein n=1 Tax=Aedes aegypti TaxID=7159 RepID=A0A6I8U729_AEDAE|nr:uncharacterized protein LOC110674739 [Aedes aegypti]